MLRNNILYTLSLGSLFLVLGLSLNKTDDIQINNKDVAYFVVEDPNGQKTGYNPFERIRVDEIQGSNYGTKSVGSLNSNTPRYFHEFSNENPPEDNFHPLFLQQTTVNPEQKKVLLRNPQ